jgi:hypothetical protein
MLQRNACIDIMWLVVLCINFFFKKKLIFLVFLDYFNVFILEKN